MFEFHADGAVEYLTGAVVDLSYRVEGDHLISRESAKSDSELREIMKWVGADKVQFQASASVGEGQEFVRTGPQKSTTEPLLGEWLGSREMDGRKLKVLRLFQPGGKMLLMIPFMTQQGRFSVAEQQLTLNLQGRPALPLRFKLTDGVLALTTADAKESKYQRY